MLLLYSSVSNFSVTQNVASFTHTYSYTDEGSCHTRIKPAHQEELSVDTVSRGA